MKILLAHNHYQLASGEEIVFLTEKQLLEQHGHNVETFEVSNDNIAGFLGKLSAAKNALYSHESLEKMSKKISSFHPDIVHIHNFFPLLSPSIYDACINADVPVVQTLHNYRLICPNAKLFRDRKVCEDCIGETVPWPGIVHQCYRDSRLQSSIVAMMIALHKQLGTWQEKVDIYITMTAFQKEKMVQAGIPSYKIHIKPHSAQLPSYTTVTDTHDFDKYALYIGRLWEEKGIDVLIDAYLNNNLQLQLKVAGEGPLRHSLQEKVNMAGLDRKIQFLGQTSRSEVLMLLHNAQCIVVPSIWYETFGLTMIEAFACRVPVVASRLGCMEELVQDHMTGLHFEPGDSTDLAMKLQWVQDHPEQMRQMGQNAYQEYEKKYTPEANYQNLIKIYEEAATGAIYSESTDESGSTN